MPVGTTTRTFEVEEGSTANMWYEITVKYHGKVVESFVRPTMHEAKLAFELAGYTPPNWERF